MSLRGKHRERIHRPDIPFFVLIHPYLKFLYTGLTRGRRQWGGRSTLHLAISLTGKHTHVLLMSTGAPLPVGFDINRTGCDIEHYLPLIKLGESLINTHLSVLTLQISVSLNVYLHKINYVALTHTHTH